MSFNLPQKDIQILRDLAKKKIELLVSLENKYLGLNKDNNAKQIVEIINKFLPWEAYVVKNPTLDQIKKRNR